MKVWKIIKSGIKGSIMVAIGLWITSVGIGRFTTNLFFGPLAFFFIAVSGPILFKTLQELEDPNFDNLKFLKGLVIFGGMYITGCTITIYNVMVYNLDLFGIFLITIIGLIWFFLSYIAPNLKNDEISEDLVISLAFTLGIIYGALLNQFYIPIYVYFFFLTALFLQLSRESIKRFNNLEREEANPAFEKLRLPLIFQTIAIIFFVLPLITTISNLILYLYLMLIGLIFIGLATFLTLKSLRDMRKFKKIGLLLRIGILIELLAFLLAN